MGFELSVIFVFEGERKTDYKEDLGKVGLSSRNENISEISECGTSKFCPQMIFFP